MNNDSLSVNNNIAVAHWGEHVNGGGDRVAWELSRVFENSPLYVGWRDESIEPDDLDVEQLIDGRVNQWALRRGGVTRMLSHLLGWQVAEPLRDHDVLVTSGNEPLFYVPPTEQVWVAYIHHTNRRQSDQISEVRNDKIPSLKLLFYYVVRVLFDHNTHKPDLFIANSEQVKRRMTRYWGIPGQKIDVVYPPVDTHNYSPDDKMTEDYYLTLSRLDWHKSVDDIIRAFDEIDAKLVVAGDGPERDNLEAIAGENIEFAGYVSESTKKKLLAGAKAFVFNGQDEDFGISPVEAFAAGTPLIGVNEGMTQYQTVCGKNGYTFERDHSGQSIRNMVKKFEKDGVKWGENEISSFAERFSVGAFHEQIRESVNYAIEKSDITPNWYTNYNTQ
ncbi:glycosyltransferase [Halorubrum lipolyticum]|uniref:Group 1 glycosyl transferase n=1 Tax=Halorubrum lipolyticum DSM 21995 TaxID=1227482 RepID=M0P0N3_9EURY|nr:glycosyltransferase [Halorubrum lipolyticum]EMA63079.1 group 1 glycosyl transferase [Halorubrum lipolyticum DSM 21995]